MFSLIYYIIKGLKKTVGQEMAKNILFKLAKERFFYTEKIFSPDLQKTINRLIVLLPGKGCWWAKQKNGGCTMCGFKEKLKEIKSNHYSTWDIVSLFKIALELTDENYSEIVIFNGGSFLNDGEISLLAQEKITYLANQSSSLQTLYVESRPEFVTKDKIRKLVKILRNKKLKVGIGLEAVTNIIRNKNINKGITLEQYEKAVKVLIDEHAEVLTYVFLKPIYVSEKEAIKEAIRTIKYAFKKGTKEIALESAFIQERTIMANLFHQGIYQPPWLWSIIEVLKKTYELGFVYIGNFNDEPPPIAIPFNCLLCNEKIMEQIQRYRENHSLNELKYLHCKCKTKWRKEISLKEKARIPA